MLLDGCAGLVPDRVQDRAEQVRAAAGARSLPILGKMAVRMPLSSGFSIRLPSWPGRRIRRLHRKSAFQWVADR